MNRVSFGRIIGGSLDFSRLNTAKMFEFQRQLATGKKIENASDDPGLAMQSKRFRDRIRRDEQFIRNVENNQHAVAEAETFMKSAIEQLHRVRTLALQAANDTLVTADRALIASEINQQLEGLLRVANAKSGSRSIFAGAETDAPAFSAVRNARGEIVSVTYAGDDVELEIDANGRVPITWPGDRVFATGPQVRTSTPTTWNGSTTANYADREIAAAYLPSSGTMEGTLRINGALINYDLDGAPSGALIDADGDGNPEGIDTDGDGSADAALPRGSGEGDSLLDLARAINEKAPGVRARVTGVMESTVGIASGVPMPDFGTLAGFRGGSFTLNGSDVTVNSSDTIFSLADKINSLEGRTGVTVAVYDASGNLVHGDDDSGRSHTSLANATSPLTLRLSGGLEIDDDDPVASTNVLQLMGITSASALPPGQNLVGTVTQPYAIELTGDRPGPFTIEDASGSLAADFGWTSSAGITEGGDVFGLLIRMRDDLRRGDGSSIRQQILPEIDAAMESVEVYRTEAGVRTNELEAKKLRLEEVLMNNRKLLSDVEDVDLAEVISEMRLQEAAQAAALKSISNLMNLSLLNLLG